MWALEDVLKELNDFALLLPSRPEKKKPMMLEKLAANVCAKLDQFQSFSAADALKLHECLEACNFPDDFSEQVANKSDELLACGSQAMQAGQVTSLKPQKLSSIANYLTSSEWATLQDSDVCWWSKQRMLVERLKKLGIKSMAEITCRWVLALLYCTLPSLPEADAVYQQVQELKGCFSTCPGPSDDRPYIVNFPDDPQKLPAELLEKAYPQEQPKYVHVEKLAHVARSLTLRSSSKKLAANKQKQAAARNALATQHAPAKSCCFEQCFLANARRQPLCSMHEYAGSNNDASKWHEPEQFQHSCCKFPAEQESLAASARRSGCQREQASSFTAADTGCPRSCREACKHDCRKPCRDGCKQACRIRS